MCNSQKECTGPGNFVFDICPVLKDLRENNQLCDGVIRTEDGGNFNVHRAMISAISPFFRALYTSALVSGDVTDVTIPNIKADVMSQILDFAYTGKLLVTPENVQRLLTASDQLLIAEAVRQCAEYLLCELTAENCIGIYMFSNNYYCPNLQNESWNYLLVNFPKVLCYTNELELLTLENMAKLLKSDYLNMHSEETAFFGAIRWVTANKEERLRDLPILLEYIRFGLCNYRFFSQTVLQHPYILGRPECQDILCPTLLLFSQMNSETTNLPLDPCNILLRPRVPRGVLFVIGGWSSGQATFLMETYDLRSNRWFMSKYSDSTPRAYHGMVTFKRKIYVIGGFDGSQCFNSVRCFDPVEHKWTERACMNFCRCYVSVALLHNHIYAMGGFNGHNRSNTCERYDPEENQWTIVGNMNQQRSDASASTLHGKIYIAGGFSGSEVLSSAEMYNPRINSWTYIRSMLRPRSGVSLMYLKGFLYALGGFDGMNRMSAVERYDSQFDIWEEMNCMLNPRSNSSSSVLEGYLIVMGGFNGAATVHQAEYLDDMTHTWKPIANMTINRSALGSCVVYELPNVKEYTLLGQENSFEQEEN